MPLQATSGAASYDAFGGGAAAVPQYIEDVFSTYLYTGNSTTGGTQTITNNIDLSTKGGMVWIKGRSAASNHILTDTSRGAGTTASNNQALSSNLTTAEDLAASYDFLSAFNTTGFAVTQGGTTAATRGTNYNAVTYASWTFRKQPKFFDIVTYTGTMSVQNISHNLGSVPGCIIVKQTDGASNWFIYHRGIGNTASLRFTTAALDTSAYWNNTTPTSSVFTVGADSGVNANGGSYVAYLFAHDAGGFGLTGTDNVISCGSMDGTTGTTVTLGYEPQFIMYKASTTTGNWVMVDNMRGMTADGGDNTLTANTSNAEGGPTTILAPNATGFSVLSNLTAGQTYIYIAIRRGPMKVPTSGTSVYETGFDSPTLEDPTIRLSNLSYVDTAFAMRRTSPDSDWPEVGSRLTQGEYLRSSSTGASVASAGKWRFNFQNGFGGSAWDNDTVAWCFKRAPSFHDVVCYTGTGSATTVTHNLGAVPEMMIVKNRSIVSDWRAYSASLGATQNLKPNTTDAASSSTLIWNDTTPTSSVFTVGTAAGVNGSGNNMVAYLFATCAGVSKVGSYTGTATTKQIDCGFTAGARFVLIKRTDSTGDWYVWDTARGIVSGNDPYLLLNSTAAEVTSTDYIDTYSAGFEISSTAPAAINASGGTFIFLAIA